MREMLFKYMMEIRHKNNNDLAMKRIHDKKRSIYFPCVMFLAICLMGFLAAIILISVITPYIKHASEHDTNFPVIDKDSLYTIRKEMTAVSIKDAIEFENGNASF